MFGASYTALIFIPLFLYFLAAYNDGVEKARKLGVDVGAKINATPVEPLTRHLTDWLQQLTPRPIPNLSLWLLISTFFLAAASTIYHAFCPDRVKQFTEEQWRHELGKPVLHYWPFSWRNRKLRIACALLYVAGGIGVAAYLVVRVWRAGDYIARHTTLTDDSFVAMIITAGLIALFGAVIAYRIRKPG